MRIHPVLELAHPGGGGTGGRAEVPPLLVGGLLAQVHVVPALSLVPLEVHLQLREPGAGGLDLLGDLGLSHLGDELALLDDVPDLDVQARDLALPERDDVGHPRAVEQDPARLHLGRYPAREPPDQRRDDQPGASEQGQPPRSGSVTCMSESSCSGEARRVDERLTKDLCYRPHEWDSRSEYRGGRCAPAGRALGRRQGSHLEIDSGKRAPSAHRRPRSPCDSAQGRDEKLLGQLELDHRADPFVHLVALVDDGLLELLLRLHGGGERVSRQEQILQRVDDLDG